MDLSKLSKKALEAIGRDKGIELDRRLKKDKLLEQLQETLDTSAIEEEVVVEKEEVVVEKKSTKKEGWDYENNCWDRSHPVGAVEWHKEFKARRG